MKLALINGTNFEVNKNLATSGHGYMSIFDIYANPSAYKRAIYEEWLHYMHELGNVEEFSLRGNCMSFSITARVRTADKVYHFFITKCHNRVNIVEA